VESKVEPKKTVVAEAKPQSTSTTKPKTSTVKKPSSKPVSVKKRTPPPPPKNASWRRHSTVPSIRCVVCSSKPLQRTQISRSLASISASQAFRRALRSASTVGVLVAEIHALADVGFEVEEEVHRVAIVDVLPFSVADGLLFAIGAVDAPEERAFDRFGVAEEQRHEVDAIERLFGW
jgi:hypothetical protein